MKRSLFPVLLVAVFALARWGGVPPEPQVLLEPAVPRPGQTIQVLVRGLPFWCRARGRFAGAQLPFYPRGGALAALAPVPGDAVEARELELDWACLRTWTRRIRVPLEPYDFPKQELKLSSEKEALFEKPETAEATALIRRVLRTESPERLWKGAFSEPVEGRVSTVYGAQRTLNGRMRYFHKGIDVAAPEGRPIRVANRGRVELAGTYPLQGNLVIVDHGQGLKSAYQHMETLLVRQGEELPPGAFVGRVGATGLASGPHLHWSVYVHGVAVDPEDWVRDGR